MAKPTSRSVNLLNMCVIKKSTVEMLSNELLVRVVHKYDIDPQIPSRSHDKRCISPKTKSQICDTSPHPSPLMIFRRGDKANMNNTRNSSLPISVDVPVFCVMDFDDDSAVNTKCPLCCTNKVMFCICARVLHK